MNNLFFTLICFLFPSLLNAQIEITGHVIDKADNTPLPGATVLVVGTNQGTMCGIDGDFKLKVDSLATIRISFIGYRDTTLLAFQVNGQTIRLESEFEDDEICIVDFSYSRTRSIAYYGDFNRMPYGLTAHYLKPYWFGHHFPLSGYVTYKTNFSENNDLSINLNKPYLVEKKNYSLSLGVAWHFRSIAMDREQLRSNDYDISISNYIFQYIHLSVGAIYRDENYINNKAIWAARVGATKYISKTKTHLKLQSKIFKHDWEYSLSIHQGLSSNNRILNRFQIGVVYNKYWYYDEVNLKLRYFLN